MSVTIAALFGEAAVFASRSTFARSGPWAPRLVAVLVGLNGALTLAHLATVRFHHEPRRLDAAFPFLTHASGRTVTAALGLGLIVLAFHLWRRRRVAWLIASVAAGAMAVSHLFKGDAVILAGAPAALLVLLVLTRPAFTVRSEVPSLRFGATVAATVILAAFLYGALGFWLLSERDFGSEFGLAESLTRSARELVLFGNPDLHPRTHPARWFIDSLDVLGVLAFGLAGLSLFRPLRYRLRTLPLEHAEVEALLGRYGGTSLDYFKSWPDKSYFFLPDRSAVVAYACAWNAAIALGDPAGAPESRASAIAEFTRWTEDNGWTPAFHQVPPDLRATYRDAGYGVLKIGEEASVRLERFESQTSQRKDFRHVIRRMEGAGVAVEHVAPPLPPALVLELEGVSREWLTLPGRHERGFTLGRFERAYVRNTAIHLVRDRERRLLAFVNLVPSYRAGEATIDLMRHRLEVPNGTMDYLLTTLMLDQHRRGMQYFSLGMAPFSGVGSSPDAPLEERLARELADRGGRWFSFRGLRAYKAKFEPEWEDRFLAYRGGPVGLGRVVVALTRLTDR